MSYDIIDLMGKIGARELVEEFENEKNAVK